MTPPAAASTVLVAADRRVAAAVRGFLEPAGHAVSELACVPPPTAQAAFAAAEAADIVLVDWKLAAADGAHLGAVLRRLGPHLRLLALVPPDLARAEPAGWDAMLPLPLARDLLMRAVEEAGAAGKDA